ncbi:similar to Saccharomyces cerevisiae YIL162W SUC2 Invertase, sucrose hydrolyzing enzyme [Maudiozyma saulgeensis]|uniref:Similar to Saccharomyces cerevisiae YIL162W SUC2 Invertase, sucrose hydrolyzing enzyme n=1 Tax=Maudiozyma saulgeensis TaxID=1789683 RepID=A0A1X7RAQ7_9SACH|nr:similar to Saccharomyces cerevisiae YIL162W SUC2 Invertase, sucrose hydrolyzing enzyme [Kazachstania saulgeensis]
MKLLSIITLAAATLASATPIELKYGNESINRPLIHMTPSYGWMNDPNGLWYDAKEKLWHYYFQYNPNDSVWGLPLYWGHATSKNLTTWDQQDAAIAPLKNDSGAYSGSIVVDVNNTSGFFDNATDPRQRAVAIWTYNTPDSETQYISYSTDGGYTFINYDGNPALSNNSTQFRDPKVIWHEESQKWIMTVAKSQEFKIAIYSSPNLKNWTHESDFTKEGLLGFQYECPGLSKFSAPQSDNATYPTNSTDSTKWALFISINPGSPQGGSSTEYFIGDFNGTHFVPDFPYTSILDLGRDFYALQNFYNSPDGEVYGIGWASNWMYSNYVPTDPWRSSTSLVRKFSLEEFQANPESKLLNIKSTPVIDYDTLNFGETFSYENETFDTNNSLSYDLSKNFDGLIEFNLTYTVNGSAFGKSDFADLSLYLIGDSNSDEYLRLGFEGNAAAFFIDRGNTDVEFVKENPFFTTRMSVNNQPSRYIDSEISQYKVYGIADRNILELYFNDGSQVSTNTYFFTGGNFITEVDLEVGVDGVYQIEEFKVRQMTLKL